MFIKIYPLFCVSSPFYEAYLHSDYLGKLIYLSLIAASICCWALLVHKVWITRLVERNSAKFMAIFQKYRTQPLKIDQELPLKERRPNPYLDLFTILKKQTKDILNKNHHFGAKNGGASYLSSSDIDYIEAHLISNIANQTKNLEKNLFILSTIVGLGPLLGLLGTVWGILTTFSQMQSHTMSATNQMVLGGISLALTTTVLGLLTAIPALIAYNYLKNQIQNYQTEMESFANEMLSAVEIQYRKVDLEAS